MNREQQDSILRFLRISTAHLLHSGYTLLLPTAGQPGAAVAEASHSLDLGAPLQEGAAREIPNCDACPRAGTAPLRGFGVERPLVMILCDSPEAADPAAQHPIGNMAGDLLNRMLASIDLSLSANCCLTFLLKCPGTYPPTREGLTACFPLFCQELMQQRPAVILYLRNSIPIQQHLDIGALLETMALSPLSADYAAIPLVETIHPAQILVDESLKRPAWEHLKALRALLNESR